MNGLLQAVKKTLQVEMKGLVRGNDIFITPDITFIPQGVKPPFIGIKDGRTEHRYKTAGCKELRMEVRLVIVVSLTKREAALVGDDRPGAIINLKEKAITLLENNMLGIAGMEAAIITADPESQFFITDGNVMYQRKELGLQYEKTVEVSK